jgi:CRISPR-associated endonuclease Cas1
MQHDTRPPFDQTDISKGVCVADGWGLKVYVRNGHLIVEDGIGRLRRTRRFHKATSGLARLVIFGHAGFITLDAQRWLHDAKASVIHIDTDGTVLAALGRNTDNPALRRAQALAASTETGVEIARHLLTLKIQGQKRVAGSLDSDLTEFDRALDALYGADELDTMRQAEMQAAVVYWQAWSEVEMRFVKADQYRVPDHWHTFGHRRSTQSASGRRAINPHNAILNYLYSLLQGEASLALRAVGLDPGLGVIHLDRYARDSLSLDLMEAVRPEVDAYVLDLLDGHRFRVSDFHETRSGGCRISRPLAHVLSETATTWRSQLAQPAEAITQLLSSEPDAKVKHLTTPLTQSNRRRAKGTSWTPEPKSLPISPNCQSCGTQLVSAGKLCEPCRDVFQSTSEWVAIGREELRRMRDTGLDPAHGGEAARKRGDKNRQRQLAVAEWNANNDRPEANVFVEKILPGIQSISLKQLSTATGLSVDYCSKIRRGLNVPHPRHWPAFKELLT